MKIRKVWKDIFFYKGEKRGEEKVGLNIIKSINGVAILQDENGFYFDGNGFPYQTEMEAEEKAKAKIQFGGPLTNDDGVYKMFEMGLMRKSFEHNELKKITEQWVRLNQFSSGFQIDSDGVLKMNEDSYYDDDLQSLVFVDEKNIAELIVPLNELEECLQIKIGIIAYNDKWGRVKGIDFHR